MPLQLNSALVFSFIIFIITEFILFISLFIFHLNARINISYFIFYSLPISISNSIIAISLPFTNMLSLLFTSIMVQFFIINIGNHSRITLLALLLVTALLFLFIQIIEYITALSSLSSSSIYSIFYLITSIHGIHVGFGVNIWFFYFLYCSSIGSANLLYFEFHSNIILWSSYWHFIDFIWLLVFQLLYYFNSSGLIET